MGAASLLAQDKGLSFDLGVQYTWMSFTTPPTFTGSTGGAHARVTYEQPESFYGQVRSVYNVGELSSNARGTNFWETYTEFVGGYSFCVAPCWTLTPNAGIGFDFMTDSQKPFDGFPGIQLNYHVHYAIVGLQTRYTYHKWAVGLQLDCLPTFDQFLNIGDLTSSSWRLRNRVGWDVRLPVGYRLSQHIWLEVAPYYRYLPIGQINLLSLPARNLNQWGAFVTFRYVL